MEKLFKYNSFIEFKKDYPKECSYLNKNNLISKFCEEMGWVYKKRNPNGYWTKERCLEVVKKYTTKRDWKKYDQSCYEYARTKDWFKECVVHMVELQTPPGYWTKERCTEEALKYTTFNEWEKNSSSSVARARENNWLEELREHMDFVKRPKHSKNRKPKGYWTKERFIVECEKYGNFTNLLKNNASAVESARKAGFLNEVMFLLNWGERKTNRLSIKWTKNMCVEEALKYKCRGEWEKKSNKSYSAARRFGWYDECVAHMPFKIKPFGYWTFECCMEEALKYNVKERWKQNSKSSYAAARANNWYDKCTAHMVEVKKPRGYWTKERCFEEALKYKTKTEWKENNQVSMNAARKNSWLEECTAHMKKKIKS